MTSITTTSLPQFFAVLSRPRSHHHYYNRCHRRHNHNHNHQLCHCHQQHRRHNHQRCHHRQEARPIGPEGGVVASPLLPEVNFVVMVITIIMMNMILVIVIFILIILTLVITSSSWLSWSLPRIKPPLRLNVSSHRELWQNRSLLDFQFAPYPKISPTTFSHRLFEKWIWDIRRMVWKQKDPNCFRLDLPPQYAQWSPGGGSSTGSRSDRWTTIKEPSNSLRSDNSSINEVMGPYTKINCWDFFGNRSGAHCLRITSLTAPLGSKHQCCHWKTIIWSSMLLLAMMLMMVLFRPITVRMPLPQPNPANEDTLMLVSGWVLCFLLYRLLLEKKIIAGDGEN